ncbi:homeobox protein Rhox13-like isoform X1 [Peromyscus eremicus]|uniref:homeobox protein Rhox13-like isoform X1 n=1 Tax=Peromyscus eremicus TaxID=42410 RepID=UPI0027DDAB23|nr:homeobox protein Rhox13-like isoform X1 [Peromyscus eremicus]
MARKVQWQYIYIVRNENGEEIAEVSTLEAALAMEEPRPSAETVIRIPRRRSSRRRRRTTLKFTLGQVEEMEKLFKETQYPDALARKELAQALNIPEVKVKTWFVHRRAEERKSQRRVVVQSTRPRIEKVLLIIDRNDYP